jgi:hypothetical protein
VEEVLGLRRVILMSHVLWCFDMPKNGIGVFNLRLVEIICIKKMEQLDLD